MGSRIFHYFLFISRIFFCIINVVISQGLDCRHFWKLSFIACPLILSPKKRKTVEWGIRCPDELSEVLLPFRKHFNRCISLLMKSNYYILPCRVLPGDIDKLIAIVVINPLTITVVKATMVSVLTYTESNPTRTVSSYTVTICG